MKRFLKFLLLSLVVAVFAFGMFKITKQYNLDVIHDEIDWSIYVKGCKDATGFTMDEDGNMYVSFKDSIRVVSIDGKDSLVFKDDSYEIHDFVYKDKNLYIATDNKIVSLNLETSEQQVIIKDIPNLGINKETKLFLKDDSLLFTIGSNTNSGIVENEVEAYDRPSITFTLTDANYGLDRTGVFKPYATSNTDGEKVDDNGRLGNATVMEYNLKQKQMSIFCHGVRNIEGIDINSKNEMFAIVGGMEDRGVRPVKDDCDYIYNIKESAWYGWPDFSGGDPITSPRFSDGKSKLSFVLKEHPNKTPTGPYYEHGTTSALKGLAIDDEGNHLNKDQIIFGDNKQHKVFALDGRKAIPIGTLDKSSYIEKIMVNKQGVFILDKGTGCVYKFSQKENGYIFNLDPIYWVFASGFLIAILFVVVYKKKK